MGGLIDRWWLRAEGILILRVATELGLMVDCLCVCGDIICTLLDPILWELGFLCSDRLLRDLVKEGALPYMLSPLSESVAVEVLIGSGGGGSGGGGGGGGSSCGTENLFGSSICFCTRRRLLLLLR